MSFKSIFVSKGACAMSALFANTLYGLLLAAIWLIFVVSVVYAICRTFGIFGLTTRSGPGFTYVSTSIAALVLSVASGVLGKPQDLNNVPDQLKPAAAQLAQSAGVEHNPSAGTTTFDFSGPQKTVWQKAFTFTYISLGVICIFLFMFETPGPTHDLVKTVGLSALGFILSFGVRNFGS
jgi:hypothetical protein